MFDFTKFVEDIKNEIIIMYNKYPSRFTSKLSPTESEKIVVEASETVIKNQGIRCQIDYTEGGHGFPDIVYTLNSTERYGIEVKSSTSSNSSENNWTILGNSIVGSTRVDVLDIQIIFIKVNKKGTFVRNGRYSDSVADVVVTHSPRYKINLDQNPTESFFSRSGISYEKMKNSENPISLVTEYFRERGETAWWLSESTSAIIREWSDLDSVEQRKIYGTAFVLFPELLSSNSSTKYKRFSKWLVSTYSVVDSSLRDKFTSGGKVDLLIGGDCFKSLPRVFKIFQDHIQEFKNALESLDIIELQKYWNYNPYPDSLDCRQKYWIEKVKNNYLNNDQNTLNFILSLFSKVD